MSQRSHKIEVYQAPLLILFRILSSRRTWVRTRVRTRGMDPFSIISVITSVVHCFHRLIWTTKEDRILRDLTWGIRTLKQVSVEHDNQICMLKALTEIKTITTFEPTSKYHSSSTHGSCRYGCGESAHRSHRTPALRAALRKMQNTFSELQNMTQSWEQTQWKRNRIILEAVKEASCALDDLHRILDKSAPTFKLGRWSSCTEGHILNCAGLSVAANSVQMHDSTGDPSHSKSWCNVFNGCFADIQTRRADVVWIQLLILNCKEQCDIQSDELSINEKYPLSNSHGRCKSEECADCLGTWVEIHTFQNCAGLTASTSSLLAIAMMGGSCLNFALLQSLPLEPLSPFAERNLRTLRLLQVFILRTSPHGFTATGLLFLSLVLTVCSISMLFAKANNRERAAIFVYCWIVIVLGGLLKGLIGVSNLEYFLVLIPFLVGLATIAIVFLYFCWMCRFQQSPMDLEHSVHGVEKNWIWNTRSLDRIGA